MLSATAPDASTVVLKLKDPIVYVPELVRQLRQLHRADRHVPKGSRRPGGLDLRQNIIGTGPFQLKEHTPSVSFTLERNPDYWDDKAAMFDTIEMPIVPEYTAASRQLKAGNIYYSVSTPPDAQGRGHAAASRSDEPRILLYQSPFDTTTPGTVMTFGHLPAGQNKFQDERVRQADLDVLGPRPLHQRVLQRRQVREGGPAGRYGVELRPATSPTATRPAAGGWTRRARTSATTRSTTSTTWPTQRSCFRRPASPTASRRSCATPTRRSTTSPTRTQPIIGFLQDLGLNVKQNGLTDYTQDYIPHDRDASGEYEGLGIHSVTGGTPTLISPISALVALHLPTSGVTFNGYDINGKGDKSGDPALIDMLSKARIEKDVATQKKLIQDAQRYLGKAQHILMLPGTATGFWAAWPAVQNFKTWDGGVDETWEHYAMWLDPTKAPLA